MTVYNIGLSFLLFMISVIGLAFSHGGRTNSEGCHNCRTGNCAGEYHCHGGSKYRSPSNQGSSYVSCRSNECRLIGLGCFSKPLNASCSSMDVNNAWKCNHGYLEEGNICIKDPSVKIIESSTYTSTSNSKLKSNDIQKYSRDDEEDRLEIYGIIGVITAIIITLLGFGKNFVITIFLWPIVIVILIYSFFTKE